MVPPQWPTDKKEAYFPYTVEARADSPQISSKKLKGVRRPWNQGRGMSQWLTRNNRCGSGTITVVQPRIKPPDPIVTSPELFSIDTRRTPFSHSTDPLTMCLPTGSQQFFDIMDLHRSFPAIFPTKRFPRIITSPRESTVPSKFVQVPLTRWELYPG